MNWIDKKYTNKEPLLHFLLDGAALREGAGTLGLIAAIGLLMFGWAMK
jgi:hypothetical protein